MMAENNVMREKLTGLMLLKQQLGEKAVQQLKQRKQTMTFMGPTYSSQNKLSVGDSTRSKKSTAGKRASNYY